MGRADFLEDAAKAVALRRVLRTRSLRTRAPGRLPHRACVRDRPTSESGRARSLFTVRLPPPSRAMPRAHRRWRQMESRDPTSCHARHPRRTKCSHLVGDHQVPVAFEGGDELIAHASWLDMAKNELSLLTRQCLNQRIPDKPRHGRKYATACYWPDQSTTPGADPTTASCALWLGRTASAECRPVTATNSSRITDRCPCLALQYRGATCTNPHAVPRTRRGCLERSSSWITAQVDWPTLLTLHGWHAEPDPRPDLPGLSGQLLLVDLSERVGHRPHLPHR